MPRTISAAAQAILDKKSGARVDVVGTWVYDASGGGSLTFGASGTDASGNADSSIVRLMDAVTDHRIPYFDEGLFVNNARIGLAADAQSGAYGKWSWLDDGDLNGYSIVGGSLTLFARVFLTATTSEDVTLFSGIVTASPTLHRNPPRLELSAESRMGFLRTQFIDDTWDRSLFASRPVTFQLNGLDLVDFDYSYDTTVFSDMCVAQLADGLRVGHWKITPEERLSMLNYLGRLDLHGFTSMYNDFNDMFTWHNWRPSTPTIDHTLSSAHLYGLSELIPMYERHASQVNIVHQSQFDGTISNASNDDYADGSMFLGSEQGRQFRLQYFKVDAGDDATGDISTLCNTYFAPFFRARAPYNPATGATDPYLSHQHRARYGLADGLPVAMADHVLLTELQQGVSDHTFQVERVRFDTRFMGFEITMHDRVDWTS